MQSAGSFAWNKVSSNSFGFFVAAIDNAVVLMRLALAAMSHCPVDRHHRRGIRVELGQGQPRHGTHGFGCLGVFPGTGCA